MKTMLMALMALLLGSAAWGHGPEEHGASTPTALLKKVFPAASGFVQKDLHLGHDSSLRGHVEARLGAKLEGHDLEAPAWVATSGGRSAGVAWMTDVHLPSGNADVLVGVDLKGKIVGVALGHAPAALSGASFLKQFAGKTASSPLQVGQDLKAAPGQDQASKQVAAAVRKAVIVLTESTVPHH